MKFQKKVFFWVAEAFGMDIAHNREERAFRFLEEALELAQAVQLPKHHAQKLLDYVYGRPLGAVDQEIGGVMVTLAALCTAMEQDMVECGDDELRRVWGKIAEVRKKQQLKAGYGITNLTNSVRPVYGTSINPIGYVVDPVSWNANKFKTGTCEHIAVNSNGFCIDCGCHAD